LKDIEPRFISNLPIAELVVFCNSPSSIHTTPQRSISLHHRLRIGPHSSHRSKQAGVVTFKAIIEDFDLGILPEVPFNLFVFCYNTALL
jgi:hypothetical protein